MKLNMEQINLLNEIVDKSLNMIVTETTEYQEFFKTMLQKYGVKSPSQLKGDRKKKFFDDVKRSWAKHKK